MTISGYWSKRIEAVAVVGNGSSEQRERRRGKVEHQQEEDLDSGQDGAGIGVQLDVGLMGQPEHKAIYPQQPRPQKQRTFLAAPQRGELVSGGQGAV